MVHLAVSSGDPGAGVRHPRGLLIAVFGAPHEPVRRLAMAQLNNVLMAAVLVAFLLTLFYANDLTRLCQRFVERLSWRGYLTEYVRGNQELWIPLAMMGMVGCLTYEFQVSLPVMASRGLHVGATGFGFMTAAMGVGAVAGGLLIAARGKTGLRPLVLAASAFGVAMALATAAPTLALELVALAFAGGASITFMSTGNSTLQLTAEPAMRGRVMSLWFVAFQGSTPIGGADRRRRRWACSGPAPASGSARSLACSWRWRALVALARRRGASESSVELEDAADGAEPVDQPLDVLARVVHGERRARRRRYAEPAHQRLRAVMPGAHADAPAPEDLPDVVRMGAVQRERHQRAPVRRRRRALDRQPGHLAEPAARAPRRRAPPRARGSARSRARGSSRPPRRARSPRRSATCRPRTSTAGRSRSTRSPPTVRIMWPPPMNGGISSSSARRPCSTPIPVGPYALWPVQA